MNVILINGSPRKKNTYFMLRKIEDVLITFDVQVDMIHLPDYKIELCKGCMNCINVGKCHIDDDYKLIMKKLLQADGIVIGTPVYLRQITAQLKVLFDRMCVLYHRPVMSGIPVFFINVTRGSGLKQSRQYLKDLALQFGFIYAGSISRKVHTLNKPIPMKEISNFILYLDTNNLIKYKPSLKEIVEFNVKKALARNIVLLDEEYWESTGYFYKPYYFKCKLRLWKRCIGWLVQTLLNKILKNVNK